MNPPPKPDAPFQIHPTRKFTIAPPPGAEEEFGIPTGNMQLAQPKPGDQGPCLYFGPQGQRCSRRALRDCFCANHLPGAAPIAGGQSHTPSKKLVAALLAISGLLWPLLADIVREVLRWLHSH